MPIWPYNFHGHTPYGDGHSPAADYPKEAIRRGMQCIGLSEHAPLGPDIKWTMAYENLEKYHAEMAALKKEYAGRMEILSGLEMDWWPARPEWYKKNLAPGWDYLIGSVHLITTDHGTVGVDDSPPSFEKGVQQVFGGDMKAACDFFFEQECAAAQSGRFTILGHFDLIKKFNKDQRYFNTADPWYREMAYRVVDAAAESGILVEVNTAGIDKSYGEYYPGPWLVERCVKKGVRLMLNADAHKIGELQRHYDTVLPDLIRLGVRELWRWSEGDWRPLSLSQLTYP